MRLLLEAAIESSVVIGGALAIMPLLRKRPAALRHGVLAAALVCGAIAPAAGRLAPSWRLPIVVTPVARAVAGTNGRAVASSGSPVDIEAPATGNRNAAVWLAAVSAVWVAGLAFGVLTLAIGAIRLARLAARARPIDSGVWAAGVERARRQCDVRRRVTLLVSPNVPLLVTWGFRRPKLIVPAAATDWTADRVRIVLYHELAHVRRADWIVLIFAELVKWTYWFNPLVWIACARLRQESERCCDDEVLGRGVDGSEYASHLVEIARDLKQPPRWAPALAVARPSTLERRVRAMLDPHLNRRPVSRAARAAAFATMLAATIAIASAQTGLAKLTGSIVDATNGTVPGVTVVLTNGQTQAKHEVRTDASGRYEFSGIPPGEYLFEAKLPGFASMQGRVTLGAATTQRDVTLEVGTLQETITVRSSRTAPPAAAVDVRHSASSRTVQPCTPPAGEGLRVGGSIRPPMKVVDVRPVYPSHLASEGVQGKVQLTAQIGTDGRVHDISVVSAPHADLAAAATAAVRDWEFTETLLNCVAIPVTIKVTITFELE
jgi:TonB family protein